MQRAAIAFGLLCVLPWLYIVWETEPAYVNIDESIYQVTAKRMAAQGEDAYTAGAVNRPPLVFAVYRTANLISPNGTIGYHVIGILFKIAMAAFVALIAERCFGTGYFGLTFFLGIAGHWVEGQFWSVNSEMLATPFVCASVMLLLLYERRIDLWQILVAGAFIGIAGMFKQTCLAMTLIGPAVFIGASKDEFDEKPPVVRQCILWLLGVALPIVGVLMWYAKGDSWSNFLFWTLKADAGYALGEGLPWTHWIFHPYRVAKWTLEWSDSGLGFALFPFFFWISRRNTYFGGRTAEISEFLRSSLNCWLMWGWLLAAFVAIFVGHRRSPQYWYHVYPLVTIALAVCIRECWKRSRAMSTDSWVRALCKGIIAGIAFAGARQAIATGFSERAYLKERAVSGIAKKEALASQVTAEGRLVIWGRLEDTQSYGDLARLPASRYLTADSLKATWHGRSDKFVVTEEKFVEEFLADVNKSAPVAILDLTQSDAMKDRGYKSLSQFQGLQEWLKGYEAQKNPAFPGATVYVLRK